MGLDRYGTEASGVASTIIEWPELRFPPINLWVMAALPTQAAAHNRRTQRPVFSERKRTALHNLMAGREIRQRNIRMQMQRLLATR